MRGENGPLHEPRCSTSASRSPPRPPVRARLCAHAGQGRGRAAAGESAGTVHPTGRNRAPRIARGWAAPDWTPRGPGFDSRRIHPQNGRVDAPPGGPLLCARRSCPPNPLRAAFASPN
jgi:hypothetical protein